MRRVAPCWTVYRLSALSAMQHVPHCTVSVTAVPLAAHRRQRTCAAARHIGAVLTTPLRTCAASPEEGSGCNDDDDDFLQAYADLLLNVSAEAGGERALDGDAAAAAAGQGQAAQIEAHEECSSSSIAIGLDGAASAVDVLLAEALAILPLDGSALQLTDVTPALDLEAISDRFGSARSFFQLYPHLFACTQDAATRRWWVARARRAAVPLNAAAPASVDGSSYNTTTATNRCSSGGDTEGLRHAALDVGEMALKEELAQLRGGGGGASVGPNSRGASSAIRAAATLQPLHAATHGSRRPSLFDTTSCNTHTTVTTSTTISHHARPSSVLHSLWPSIAALLPEDGRPMPIAQLRGLLPQEVTALLHSANMGLVRCYKKDYGAAHTCVALSADSTALMRAAAGAGFGGVAVGEDAVPRWVPPPAPCVMTVSTRGDHVHDVALDDGVYVPPPADYISVDGVAEAEPWWVELPLEDDDAADAAASEREAGVGSKDSTDVTDTGKEFDEEALRNAQSTLDGATGLEEVPYAGPEGSSSRSSGATVGDASLLRGLNLGLLCAAPAPPKARELPAPLAEGSTAAVTAAAASAGKKKTTRVPRPTTPEGWIALHTELATAHGWLTPPQMLDYLVECVPSFFVPYDEVRPSDALLRLVGPRTSMRTLLRRIYVYYTEKSEDGARVRLAESVQHPQRGMANIHYAAWDPSKVDAACAGDAPLGVTKVLQASAATKSFPVLRVHRPIVSTRLGQLPPRRGVFTGGSCSGGSVISPPVDAPSKSRKNSAAAAAGETSATRSLEMVARGGSGITLATIPQTDIGYPFMALATQAVAEWPWWARLLCVLPYDEYVPLDDVAALCQHDLTPAEVQLVWSAASSVAEGPKGKATTTPPPPHPFRYTVLRTPAGGMRRVRLRPFWLAPSCTADLDAAAVLPAAAFKPLRPVWLSIPRLLQRMPDEARAETLALAKRRLPGVTCTPEDALVSLLRDAGRSCWVNEEGTKVRRYTGSQDMDDIFHMALSLLYGFTSAHTWEPVSTILARAAHHVQPLFSNAASAADKVGLVGMLRQTPTEELQAWLQRHVQWLDLKLAPREGAGGGETELLVRRRSSFVSFCGNTER